MASAMMLIPSSVSFAATDTVNSGAESESKAVELETKINEVKQESASNEETDQKNPQKESDKKSSNMNGSFTIEVTGDGILTIKEEGAAERTKMAVTKDAEKTLEAEVGTTYKVTLTKRMEVYTVIGVYNHPESRMPSLADLTACRDRRYKYGLIVCHDGRIVKYSCAKNLDNNNLVFADIYLKRLEGIREKGMLDTKEDECKDIINCLMDLGIKLEIL